MVVTLVRRHLVGAVVLVLALATGIALGAGPLSHDALLPAAAPPARTPATDTGPTADDLAEEVAPALYGSLLEGRSVALVAAPGVPQGTLDQLAGGIEAADGTTARWRVGESLVGVHDKALVDTLGSQLLRQLHGRGADPDATTYERMGQLAGGAIASPRPGGAAPDRDALTVRQSLAAAELLRTDTPQARLAPLVLLVLDRDLDDDVLGGLVAGLASRASGVVVAGPGGARDLDVLQDLGSVTTVDGVDGAAGRLAAVLALARAEESPGASYGASGSDGLLPLG